MYYLLGSLGPLSLLLSIFYFIVLPILVFRLMGRVRVLEESRRQPREEQRDVQPRPVPAHATGTPAPALVHRAPPPAKKTPATGQSLEQKVGGRLFQWVGIGALIIALLFFLKWSFDNGYIGPVGRTVLGYFFAGSAVLAGDRLRTRYGVWSLAFTGGGALGSYIVTSIALHTYHLFPAPVAFAIHVLTTAVACLLAGYYASIPLAVFGVAGGFITPVLIGVHGSTMALLSYILILDLGVLSLGHVRPWRELNAFGLLGTAAYEAYAFLDASFDRSYALAFLAAFLAIYIIVPFIYNLLRQKTSEPPDLFILVGNALVHFGLILLWLGKTPGLRENLDALVSLGFAVLFLVVASEVYRRNKSDTPLVIASLGLTILFTTLMIPLQFGGAWVPLAWSVEGGFLLWAAMTLRDIRIQRFAWLVMAGAYGWYFFAPSHGSFGAEAIVFSLSGLYLFLAWTACLLVLAAIGLSRNDYREQHVIPFVLVGFIVLTLAFFLNLFSGHASSLTGIQRFLEALAMIGGGYLVLSQALRQWQRLSGEERHGFTALALGIQIITLAYLTDEFIHGTREGWLPDIDVNVGISILWALYGATALIVGAVRDWKMIRSFAIVLLLIVTAKLTLVDFFSLGTGARVIGFTVLGAILVAASFLYQSNKAAVKSFFSSSSFNR